MPTCLLPARWNARADAAVEFFGSKYGHYTLFPECRVFFVIRPFFQLPLTGDLFPIATPNKVLNRIRNIV